MNDVREQLAEVVRRAYADVTHGRPFSGSIKYPMVDAILARWTLTEKPVVTAEELGRMIGLARHWGLSADVDKRDGVVGRSLLAQLAAAGLTIVRIEEAGK